jgi:hypothetical protein
MFSILDQLQAANSSGTQLQARKVGQKAFPYMRASSQEHFKFIRERLLASKGVYLSTKQLSLSTSYMRRPCDLHVLIKHGVALFGHTDMDYIVKNRCAFWRIS